MIEVPDALRLAHLLDIDKWPDVAAELRRLHARVQELESIERQLCEQADVAANAYRELESEAEQNAKIIGASAEKELALRGRIAELEKQMAAIGAGGVEPLRKRAAQERWTPVSELMAAEPRQKKSNSPEFDGIKTVPQAQEKQQ